MYNMYDVSLCKLGHGLFGYRFYAHHADDKRAYVVGSFGGFFHAARYAAEAMCMDTKEYLAILWQYRRGIPGEVQVFTTRDLRANNVVFLNFDRETRRV